MKYKIFIEQKVTFTHEMTIEIDNERITEKELNFIFDKAENEGYRFGWDYIENSLNHQGIEVTEVCEDDCGNDSDVEIIDYYELD